MTSTAPPSAEPAADEAPPCSPVLVEDMLRHLGKTVRTRQMYLPNNPVYQRGIEGLCATFATLWGATDLVALAVHESELRWYGRVVYQESSRGESLSWLLYKDGVRELTLMRGVEQEELITLLDILQRVRKAAPDEDDLITLLWEQDFLHLRYRYVDAALDGLEAELDLSPVGDSPPAVPAPRDIAEQAPEAPARVRMADLDSTLYFLDEPEVEYLRSAVAAEYTADLGSNVVGVLLDIFELQGDEQVRAEVLGALDQLMVHLLAVGNFRAVARLLAEARVAASRAAGITPAHAEALTALARRLGEPTALAELLRALDEGTLAPGADELAALLGELGAGTLGTLLAAIGRLQRPEVRNAVEQTAARLAAANTGELVQLILAPDSVVALEAIRRAAGLRTPAAVSALARVLGSPTTVLRQAAAGALAEIASAGALRSLEQVIEDPDREVRLAAVRAMGARGQRSALPRLEAVIRTKLGRDVDRSEKLALFGVYAALAGSEAVPLLDSLLNARSMFGRREDSEVRVCAALSLGQIGGSAAHAALRRAAEDKDIVVRNAANRGLRGGGA